MKGKTYVGFTTDPKKRLNAHNGLNNQAKNKGAKYTKKLRPCEFVFLIHGFPTKNQALGFEWAWQNPTVAKTIKDLAKNQLKIGSKHRTILNKSLLSFAMLSCSPWRHLPLTIHFFNEKHMDDVLTNARKKGVEIPSHVRVEIGDMSVLDAYVSEYNNSTNTNNKLFSNGGDGDDDNDDDDDDDDDEEEISEDVVLTQDSDIFVNSSQQNPHNGKRKNNSGIQVMKEKQQHMCEICLAFSHQKNNHKEEEEEEEEEEKVVCTCSSCGAYAHLVCLANSFFKSQEMNFINDKENLIDNARTINENTELIPEKGKCPRCSKVQSWGDILAARAKSLIRNSSRKDNSSKRDEVDMVTIALMHVNNKNNNNTSEKLAREREKIASWALDVPDDADSISPPKIVL